MDLSAYAYQDIKTKDYTKAMAFAQSIPAFDDLNSDECCGWMLHDEEYLKYMP
jgi:hypothetical protein